MMEAFDPIPSQELLEVLLPIVKAIHDFLGVLAPNDVDRAIEVAAK
jgi:hypothetical protein